MPLKTVGETGFAWRTREAFLGDEFEIIHSRNPRQRRLLQRDVTEARLFAVK